MMSASGDTAPSYPFWTYLDLLIFASLALPCLIGGAALAEAFKLAVPSVRAEELMLPAQFLGYGLWFLSLFLILKTRYNQPFWHSLRCTFPARGFWLSFVCGPPLALTLSGLGIVLHAPATELPFKGLLSSRFSVALLGVFVVTLGPLCEELAFRGFLLPLLTRSLGGSTGIVLTAVPFALLHGVQYKWSWQILLLVLTAGIAFGWVRYRTGSTASAAALHSTYNLTFFVVYVLQKFILVERY